MLTHLKSGKPYDIDELAMEFGSRMEVLSDLAEFATNHGEQNDLTVALARGIDNLRDDWELCKQAMDARLHEIYSKTPEAAQ